MQLETMPLEMRRSASASARYAVRLAACDGDVEAAQRLRWSIFVEEQGAQIDSVAQGLDVDEFDRHCDHLIVTDLETGCVVGTYRLLTADAARRCGAYYSESEFDLSGLLGSGQRLLELGRSCVHSDYRSGLIISLLWSGLAAYFVRSRHDGLIGCASVPLRGQEPAGAALAHQLARAHAAPVHLRAPPRRPLPLRDSAGFEPAAVPPLVKGYLRAGALVCGAPCWDPDFGCADLLLHLDAARITHRYTHRFLPAAGAEV